MLARAIAVMDGVDPDSEEDGTDSDAEDDPRPLITPLWRKANGAEWARLWQKPAECPVCHENPLATGDLWDGPMTSDLPTRCTHWACIECWRQIASADRRCPVCHEGLGEWLAIYDSEEEGSVSDA